MNLRALTALGWAVIAALAIAGLSIGLMVTRAIL